MYLQQGTVLFIHLYLIFLASRDPKTTDPNLEKWYRSEHIRISNTLVYRIYYQATEVGPPEISSANSLSTIWWAKEKWADYKLIFTDEFLLYFLFEISSLPLYPSLLPSPSRIPFYPHSPSTLHPLPVQPFPTLSLSPFSSAPCTSSLPSLSPSFVSIPFSILLLPFIFPILPL